MDKFLQQLADRLRIPDSEIITADETEDWPTGKLDELVEAGVLAEIQHSKGVVCRECAENCFREPDIRTNPETGEATGIFVCARNPDIGRIEVDLDRLRQWRINIKRLSQLGYRKSKHGKKSQGRAMSRQGEILQIRAALLKHHRFDEEAINYEPATQKQLQALTEWGQSKVHRAMKTIFGDNPMNAYKQQCRTEAITGFLKKSDDGSYTVEATHEPIDQ